MKSVLFSILFLFLVSIVAAQQGGMNPLGRINNTIGSGGSRGGSQKKDSSGFKQRDDAKDSINISFRYLAAIKRYNIDSSINNFDTYSPIPLSDQYLGNTGAAAFPLTFTPFAKAGWDPGFHAYDLYMFTVEGTKFYKTTRPFSMLGYEIASGKEQMLQAHFTQNIKPTFNVGFDFRVINAPGFFINQNDNHRNMRLFSNYQGKKKRYNAWFVILGNTIRASENGGIVNDSFLLNPNYKDRFAIDVNLGNDLQYSQNPFSTTVSTGNIYKTANIFLQQSYDIGKKDSIAVNDSTMEYLFYPKLRAQYSFKYSTNKYNFTDVVPDSAIYKDWYDITIIDTANRYDTVNYAESWKTIENDFSLIQFPDPKNPAQFLQAGVTLQNIKGNIKGGEETFYNIKLHGEYRNRTRNKKWDMQLKGEFYLNGLNSGDYNVTANIGRFLNKKLGDITLFFNNTNRTPSFIFDNRSTFNLGNINDYNKENITSFGATATNPFIQLGFKNILFSNYTYFYNYYQTKQYSTLMNIIQVTASKKFRLTKRWNWYLDATVQQIDGAAPVNVPFLFTRSRIAYEGIFFKNLNLSTGVEVRYYTGYKANNYSPLEGQFMPQDTVTINNLPDIAAFLHFRIKSFTGFLRAENLNTIYFKDEFGFVNNNFAAPQFPTQGFMFRLGIRWWFVN